jgi:hypothetical protein
MKATLLLFATMLCAQIEAMDQAFKPKKVTNIPIDPRPARLKHLLYGSHKTIFDQPWIDKMSPTDLITVWPSSYKSLLDYTCEAIQQRQDILDKQWSSDVVTANLLLKALDLRLKTNFALQLEASNPTPPEVETAINIPEQDLRACLQWTDGGNRKELLETAQTTLTFNTGKKLYIDGMLALALIEFTREIRKALD